MLTTTRARVGRHDDASRENNRRRRRSRTVGVRPNLAQPVLLPALLGNLPEKGEECDHGVFPLRTTIIRCITFTLLGLCWLLPVATTWMLEPCERDKPPLFVVKRFLIGIKRELFVFPTRFFL